MDDSKRSPTPWEVISYLYQSLAVEDKLAFCKVNQLSPFQSAKEDGINARTERVADRLNQSSISNGKSRIPNPALKNGGGSQQQVGTVPKIGRKPRIQASRDANSKGSSDKKKSVKTTGKSRTKPSTNQSGSEANSQRGGSDPAPQGAGSIPTYRRKVQALRRKLAQTQWTEGNLKDKPALLERLKIAEDLLESKRSGLKQGRSSSKDDIRSRPENVIGEGNGAGTDVVVASQDAEPTPGRGTVASTVILLGSNDQNILAASRDAVPDEIQDESKKAEEKLDW